MKLGEHFDRREFVATAAATGLLFSQSVSATQPATAATQPIQKISAAMFRQNLGTSFWIDRPNDSSTRVVLKQVKPYSLGRNRPQHLKSVETYSIYFRAAKGSTISDGIYQVRHQKLAPMSIAITNVGSRSAGPHLQAVFG